MTIRVSTLKNGDTRGVELVRDAIVIGWNKYEPILTLYLEKMPMKAFHYVATYLLKGYAIAQRGIAEKYAASSYKTLMQTILVECSARWKAAAQGSIESNGRQARNN